MWVLGALVYYLFHRVAIVYYLGMFTRGKMQRPIASIYRWFHLTVLTVSAVLFSASGFFFYLSNPWLTVAPIVLLGLSLITFQLKQGGRTNEIIKKAIQIQVQMEREGSSQAEINRAIYHGATGNIYKLEADSDVKSFLRYAVLSEVIGYDTEAARMDFMKKFEDRTYVSADDKIDAVVDGYYRYWNQYYDNIGQLNR